MREPEPPRVGVPAAGSIGIGKDRRLVVPDVVAFVVAVRARVGTVPDVRLAERLPRGSLCRRVAAPAETGPVTTNIAATATRASTGGSLVSSAPPVSGGRLRRETSGARARGARPDRIVIGSDACAPLPRARAVPTYPRFSEHETRMTTLTCSATWQAPDRIPSMTVLSCGLRQITSGDHRGRASGTTIAQGRGSG
jgi:hypothetical protein